MILEFILFVVLIFFIFYKYWTWNYNHWEKLGLPHVKPQFPFGNLKELVLMKVTMGELYHDIYSQLKGSPLGGFYKLRTPALIVREPELVKTVFVKEFSSFHDNDFYVNPDVDLILGLNPFNARGERWKHARMVITPSLTSSKIKSMVPCVLEACKDLLLYVHNQEGVLLELYDLTGKFTTDSVAGSSLGLQSNSFTDPDSQIRKMSSTLIDGSMQSNAALLFALYAPLLADIFRWPILSKKSTDYFIGVVKEAADFRIKNKLRRDDYLQTLIDENLEAAERNLPPVRTYKEMAAHCMSFFLDGHETSHILLSNILYELSLNAQVQDKLRGEILKRGDKLAEDFDFDTVHNIEYLHMTVLEGLRKHPPGTSMARLCTRDTVLEYDGLSVPVTKGTPVVLPMLSIQNDPAFFPDPDKFDPERFTEEAQASRHPYAFFAFGGGPRGCPGNKFALTMIKLAIIGLLLEFEIRPKDPNPEPWELDPMNAFFKTNKNGLWVSFHRRTIQA